VQAGQLTMVIAFVGAVTRIIGGWLSDRLGGINTLTVVLAVVATGLACCGLAMGSLALTTVLLIACFAALGAGNGAVYQLVPLRWPLTTAIAGSMIGELGALGGGLVPSTMGLARQYLGTYAWGFAFFATLALATLVLLRSLQSSWTGKWVGAGGRAHAVAARAAVGSHAIAPAELAKAA
jgi:NNP family nitrate/nitrite transporter-like MFS transporter